MELVLTSILAFISTNIDDIFLLMLFFGNRKFTSSQIVIGQVLGITTLIAVSVIGSFVRLILEPAYVGLLGLFPIYLGIRALFELTKNESEENEEMKVASGKSAVLAVAGVTIANGGDNIGIYIPLFTTVGTIDKTIMIAIFLIMTLLWCAVARYLTTHPLLAGTIEKYGKKVMPVVLILLGVYILYESGSFRLIGWG